MKRPTAWVIVLMLALTACSRPMSADKIVAEKFTVATTTSVQDSGLLNPLLLEFERDFPSYNAAVVAVGSGEAIQLARGGDADVLLTHSPADEMKFMEDGLGVFRHPVMQSSFVIAGPNEDPVKTTNAGSAAEAFRSIASAEWPFISRGDGSGTHKKELQIWDAAGLKPEGDWYIATGEGQGPTLDVAAEKRAYVLTDLPTLLAHETPLEVLFENDPILVNPYSVIPVKNAEHLRAAEAFATWLTGTHGRQFIASFGRSKFGRSLFTVPPR